VSEVLSDPVVSIIIPVFNRIDFTRACLTRLDEMDLGENYLIYVVDDNSSDGTKEMIEETFSEVRVVDGSGDLFWGGGIALGMEVAYQHKSDVFFWLNDDCLPGERSIKTLVERVLKTKGVCGGVCFEEDGVTRAYSGTVIEHGKLTNVFPKEGEVEEVDLLNGNMVAIHSEVVSKIGVVDCSNFPHYGGDSMYGLKASKAGFPVEVHGSATGINPRADYFEKFGIDKPAISVFRDIRWKGSPNFWPAYWNLLKEMFGWKAYLRWPTFFVRLIKRYFKALKHS